MRTTVPVLVAFISGLILVVATFFREDMWLGGLKQELIVWLTIVGGFTLLLGVVSITRVSWTNIKRRKEGWVYRILTLFGVFVMAIPSVLSPSWSSLFGRAEGSIYDWFFNYL